jgi:alpha-galactosidase
VSSFSSRCRPLACAASLAAPWLLACGREDIELAPARPVTPPPPEDCSAQVPDGLLAARPPMGWNGYNAFRCRPELDEAKVRANAAALVTSGMQSAGYQYVNLDDCWELPRGSDGIRVFDPVRMPSGIAGLSEAIHALGLSFGVWTPLYDCADKPTPGIQGHEATDAASYAGWGVDYVKDVYCGGGPVASAAADVTAAFAATGRPIVHSLATPEAEEWMPDTVQIWRTGDLAEPTWESIEKSIDSTVPLAAYARPGAFNDPDMLELGNGDLTLGEQRVQFGVWAILSAPLLAGNDLTVMTEETRSILTNGRVIALNQDPLGLQAALVRTEGNVGILAKPLADCGARAVVLWNRGETDADVTVTWDELWLDPGVTSVQDLWNDVPLDAGEEGFSVRVPGHDAAALRVTGSEPPLPVGNVYLSDMRPTYVTSGWGPIELDRTNGEAAAGDGNAIRLRGAAYEKGLGVHAPSLLRYRLGQACSRFVADVGIDDDQNGSGSVQFEVWADGKRLLKSGRLLGDSPALRVSVDVTGRRELRLFVGKGGMIGDVFDLDHAVWAGARLECAVPAVKVP